MFRVLLVEDEPILRQALKALIHWEKYGFDVAAEAGNGLEALEILRGRGGFDVVFTDIRMPQMDGIALAEAIRREFPSVRTVLLSAYREFEYAREAIHHGVFAYLLKEDSHDRINECLRELSRRLAEEQAADPSREAAEDALPEDGASPDYHRQLMRRAEEYIQDHFGEPLTLQHMADHFHITPSYFSRLFAQFTGENYIDYLTRVRMEESRRLLLETDLRVYEIARRVGYRKSRYFSELFRKECRMSPGEFRARNLSHRPHE